MSERRREVREALDRFEGGTMPACAVAKVIRKVGWGRTNKEAVMVLRLLVGSQKLGRELQESAGQSR